VISRKQVFYDTVGGEVKISVAADVKPPAIIPDIE